MSSISSQTDLHLPDLSVKGFRGIKDLSISRLGRVTLFAGKNGVGKTTLLEAVRLYAARGRLAVLADILRDREEFRSFPVSTAPNDKKRLLSDWKSLFYGRQTSPDYGISIGPQNMGKQVRIAVGPISEDVSRQLRGSPRPHRGSPPIGSIGVESFRIEFQDKRQEIPISHTSDGDLAPFQAETQSDILCESVGPEVLSNAAIARLWDSVALTDYEIRTVQALNLLYSNTIQRVAVIGDETQNRSGRRAVVKIAGQERPVPLKSLGDGALRLFCTALTLANSRDGFLLIDEAENGIHHSIQPDFWKMVLKTAHENNVQVLATTHGWDCVVGFARAATDLDKVGGILVRLERNGEKSRAIEYSEDDLNVSAEQGIEVR